MFLRFADDSPVVFGDEEVNDWAITRRLNLSTRTDKTVVGEFWREPRTRKNMDNVVNGIRCHVFHNQLGLLLKVKVPGGRLFLLPLVGKRTANTIL